VYTLAQQQSLSASTAGLNTDGKNWSEKILEKQK
jgi:hypothetical protein